MAKFIRYEKVRMHDTDMAGILYYPNQFRFVNDTFEDLMELEGLNYQFLFKENDFSFVIRRAEADYFYPMHVGDHLEIQMHIEHIGNTSFIQYFEVYNIDKKSVLAGKVRTVQVCVHSQTRVKINIPQEFKEILKKYIK